MQKEIAILFFAKILYTFSVPLTKPRQLFQFIPKTLFNPIHLIH